MSQRKRIGWEGDDGQPIVGWSVGPENEWDDPTFDAAAGELELAELPIIPLARLTPKQRYVIERLWGINGHDAYTKRELAESMSVDVAAVHRLEDRALESMRRSLEQGVNT